MIHSQPSTSNPDDHQDTVYDAAGRRVGNESKTKGRQGGYLNYVSEDKGEFLFDGDGKPVRESGGHRNYQVSSPPGTSLSTAVQSYQIWSSVLGAY